MLENVSCRLILPIFTDSIGRMITIQVQLNKSFQAFELNHIRF